MPGIHPTRWLVFLVCGSLFALGCSTDNQQGDASGSLSLNLVLADGIVINEVDYEISGNGMEAMGGTIDTSAPGATASVEVYGLLPGEDYLVELEATSADGEVTCRGSAEFDVEIGVSTGVIVMLNCKLPVGEGAVRVNGKFNVCPQLHKVVVSPLQTSVGNDIDLSAMGKDEEDDPIAYLWTGTGGSIADANAASTTYTCDETGEQTITITISDDDFEYCMDDWTVPVTCVEAGLCDDVDCDDGNECTDNDCDSASGTCINSRVEDGTECDGGAGTCSSGECVEVDLCEGVDCDDGNECTDNDCDPGSGTCINAPVEDGTECDGGAGTCSSGECVEVDLCEDVDCTSGNECVEDGTCDPANGMCIDGANQPAGTPCEGVGVCDGSGTCKINTCAELLNAVVSPLQTSVGNDIDLTAMAQDDDSDPIAYLWTGTGGSIADPNAASTTYTCGEVGEHEITITVSDDDFEFCTDDLTVPVTCVED
ncbi:MAG: PKD domain-containing protein [Deltaproteobacteria bacterium]|nr:PKD domain-containing protein [Deltaproteobacteria bacterium]MBW2211555.1 PKD domain-containing protein [Deltaproteobacteria bacterium]